MDINWKGIYQTRSKPKFYQLKGTRNYQSGSLRSKVFFIQKLALKKWTIHDLILVTKIHLHIFLSFRHSQLITLWFGLLMIQISFIFSRVSREASYLCLWPYLLSLIRYLCQIFRPYSSLLILFWTFSGCDFRAASSDGL